MVYIDHIHRRFCSAYIYSPANAKLRGEKSLQTLTVFPYILHKPTHFISRNLKLTVARTEKEGLYASERHGKGAMKSGHKFHSCSFNRHLTRSVPILMTKLGA